MNSFETGNESGSALIVAIGILLLFFVVGLVYLRSTAVHRKSTRSYTDMVRARAVAESGFEYALVELREALKRLPEHFHSYSAAEDTGSIWFYGKRSGNSVQSQYHVPLERAYWASMDLRRVRSGKGGGNPPVLRIAGAEPSLPQGDGRKEGGGRVFGISGRLAPSYRGGMDAYSLRIEGTAGKIYINRPDSPGQEEEFRELSSRKIRMLNRLGRLLNRNDRIRISNLGDVIDRIRNRLERDVNTLEELKQFEPFRSHPRNVEVLKGFLTPEAWVDPTTLDPDRLEHPRPHDPSLVLRNSDRKENGGTSRGNSPSNQDRNRTGEGEELEKKDLESLGWAPFVTDRDTWNGFDPESVSTKEEEGRSASGREKNQRASSEKLLQPRAPINVNTAPLEVLKVVLTGIEASYLDRWNSVPAGRKSATEPRTFLGPGFSPENTVRVSGELAGKLASRLRKRSIELVEARGYGFATFTGLNRFIYALNSGKDLSRLSRERPDTEISPIKDWGMNGDPARILALQQAIVANVNPNSRLPHVNPNFAMGIRYGDTSKADLERWTTEFCFTSGGRFRIESLGRVLGPGEAKGMKLRARKKISSFVRVYEQRRVSTQKGFWTRKKKRNEKQTNIQYYPENLRDLEGFSGATYDGYLKLATKDWNEPEKKETIEIRYNQGFSPSGKGTARSGLPVVHRRSGREKEATSGTGASTLFNDGIFTHVSRRYGGEGYLPGRKFGGKRFQGGTDQYVRHLLREDADLQARGAISLWVKPTWFGGEFPDPSLMEDHKNAGNKLQYFDSKKVDPEIEGAHTAFSLGNGGVRTFRFRTPDPGRDASIPMKVMKQRMGVVALRNRAELKMIGFYNNFLEMVNSGSDGDSKFGNRLDRDYRPSSVSLPMRSPSANPYIQTERNSRSWFSPGRWHFITFQWDKNRSILAVDGRSDSSGWSVGVSDPLFSRKKESRVLFVGSNRFGEARTNGFPLLFNGTIDSVKIYPGKNPFEPGDFTPPDRYQSQGTYQGNIGWSDTGKSVSSRRIPFSGTLLTLSWTAYLPERTTSGTSIIPSVSSGSGHSRSSISGFNWSNEQSGRGMPLFRVQSGEREQISVSPGDGVDVEMMLRSEGRWITETPILDSITLRILRDEPRVITRYIE